ncbi:RNA-directed DNA polymerase, eukaryota, reverse transcriptase zinc-binding domain protein [Tanacetum coccineum]
MLHLSRLIQEDDKMIYANDRFWSISSVHGTVEEDDSEEVEEVFAEKATDTSKQDLNDIHKGASTAAWNIRGMNQTPKQNEVRQVIFENNLYVSAILESHVTSSRLDKLCLRVFKHWTWTSNRGMCVKGSRIILGWNPDIVDIVIISSSDQAMVLMGYFNASLHIDDKSVGSSMVDNGYAMIFNIVREIKVTDVNSSGLRFTWNQKPRGTDGLLKKIDRITVNLEFNVSFVGSSALFQPYRISDHLSAILRIPTTSVLKPRPFKFSNVVVHKTRFKEIFSTGWQNPVSGFWMYKVVKKLKMLKKPLRKLLYDQGNIIEKVKRLRHELDEVQRALDSDPFNIDIREEEAVYIRAFQDALLDEERFLKQKAKVEWLKSGDANSAYFHKVVKSHASKNRIDSVTTTNGVRMDGDSVPMAFIDHYTSFLGQQGVIYPFISNDLFCTKLSTDAAHFMVRDVSDQDIRDAIFSLRDDKSPGLDGYTAAFFKEPWDIIAHDVCNVVKEFFMNGVLLKELNHTIIA